MYTYIDVFLLNIYVTDALWDYHVEDHVYMLLLKLKIQYGCHHKMVQIQTKFKFTYFL